MGVQITALLPGKEARLEDFSGKVIAVDAANHIYQFLTTIRAPDGSFFTDAQGNVTSHLIGLFTRTTHLMKLGIKPAYVFDGQVPQLKKTELLRRAGHKAEAAEKHEEAEEKGDVEGMRKYAIRTTHLTPEMVNDAKEVITALGLPVVQAPGEGEAQASHIVANGDAFAVASQDADSLLFGATRLVRNLSIAGRRKKANALSYEQVAPELIELREVLSQLNISHEQLICLAMLVGTDYNTRGIKGIGPKTALKLVREHKTPAGLFNAVSWQRHFSQPWQEVFELFANPNTSKEYELRFSEPDKKKLADLLCDKHNFSRQRVENTLDELGAACTARQQKGLGDFLK
ncbi:flap endonuclease-1 [Candidatus Woesearchaeota archaeon]|nr:flap endonuclease-1 [Candidatus Woesearchaeota archaeon]